MNNIIVKRVIIKVNTTLPLLKEIIIVGSLEQLLSNLLYEETCQKVTKTNGYYLTSVHISEFYKSKHLV